MDGAGSVPGGTADITTCYRHGDRRAGVTCQRCGRPICGECMVTASVGFHCPACASSGAAANVRSPLVASNPIVTKVLIGVNVAVFLVGTASAANPSVALQRGGGSLVADYGLLGGTEFMGRTFGVAGGEWWRIITGGFLHGGIIHLGFNMLVLWLLGSQIERALGPVRFLTLYVASLLAGAFGVLVLNPTAMTVGASGAIFGLLGAAVVLQRAAGINWWRSGLGTLLVINLLITFTVPGISVGGHIGGLLGGLLTGAAMVGVSRRVPGVAASVAVGAGLGVVFLVGSLWAASQWRDPLLGLFAAA